MKINKSLNIDLNIISPQKHIRIHEGDVDSVDILIGVTVDEEAVDLEGVTIKYDATINNYLVEQDADGSVVDDKISIPVTQNMTAMSGLLLIDVRMIQNDQILFTQTICATVEKAVVNGSTYIDFDKITIVQRMNALEEKMDYIEELVENFDTSKLIVSTNRPPMGAPVEIDVDLLRVGDTWILSGANIVYKLVEARYNYQPVPSAEPYHQFIWQPLNERYGVGDTEPPTSVTYQAVVYTINEVQWSWLPVPEYFKGDHYQMQVGVDDPTYYICKSASMPSTGVCTYTWREEGGGASSGITIINTETVPESAEWGDSIPVSYAGNTGKAGEIAFWEESGDFWGLYNLAKDPWTGNINYNWVQQADEIDIDDLKSQKMDLVHLNPTAQEIEDMPSGQIYFSTNSEFIVHIKGVTNIPDLSYLYYNYKKILLGKPPLTGSSFYVNGDISVDNMQDFGGIFSLSSRSGENLTWKKLAPRVFFRASAPEQLILGSAWYPSYDEGDIWIHRTLVTPANADPYYRLEGLYICVGQTLDTSYPRRRFRLMWEQIAVKSTSLSGYGITDAYTKSEIDSMIPTVPTNISAFTNDSGYLTLETLPIYDGTVI